MKTTKKELEEALSSRLSHFFGVDPKDATDDQFYRALSIIVRELSRDARRKFNGLSKEKEQKKIYYLCMEFLMGRSLKNNLYNLNLVEAAREALASFGVKLEKLYELEPDAGLGNGGLGRLAACYLDALANQGYAGMGYCILYEYGIFKQKIIDGWQTETPDFWLPGGEVWLIPREDAAVEVNFEGRVVESWEDSFHRAELVDCKTVRAVPYDMTVVGKDGAGACVLRLWSAKADDIDMAMFNQGDYIRAMEKKATAEVISKVLYPADNHPEGKSLRLRQQYFLVSASVQDIVARHLRRYGSLENFAEKNAVHINDSHPATAVPELMRILLDECGYGWDDAFRTVEKVFAYTNHTVMPEAMECWGEDMLSRLLPRIYQLVKEIDSRFRKKVWDASGDAAMVERTAIISNGVIRTANLCAAVCHKVNGVSKLHSKILRDSVFRDFYVLEPRKFCSVTNGIAHRRWLCQANPRLAKTISELIGDGFIYDAGELSRLREFSGDKAVLDRLGKIKADNKKDFAAFVKAKTGIILDPSSIFDVQVKRLHEYKRQLLNAFNIIARYFEIKDNPNGDYLPRSYIFGAKAAPGYYAAKKIIEFICALADLINNDPDVGDKLKVVYMEDYNVSLAEALMPAADISEQISLAGTEASGTGNMKLMINGAITLGAMDGANVEIYEAVGKDNIIIFGMNAGEVEDLRESGYNPQNYYYNNSEIHRIIDFINGGIGGKRFGEISDSIIRRDPYMILADFADYRRAQKFSDGFRLDKDKWNEASLVNIAGAGIFSADRAVNEYASKIWFADKIDLRNKNGISRDKTS